MREIIAEKLNNAAANDGGKKQKYEREKEKYKMQYFVIANKFEINNFLILSVIQTSLFST